MAFHQTWPHSRSMRSERTRTHHHSFVFCSKPLFIFRATCICVTYKCGTDEVSECVCVVWTQHMLELHSSLSTFVHLYAILWVWVFLLFLKPLSLCSLFIESWLHCAIARHCSMHSHDFNSTSVCRTRFNFAKCLYTRCHIQVQCVVLCCCAPDDEWCK